MRPTLTAAIGMIALFAACSGDDASPGGPTVGPGADAQAGTDGGTVPSGDGGVTADGSPGPSEAGGDAAPVGELFGFVGSKDGKIRVYAVDASSGAWTLKKESSAGTNPSFLAFDPARRRVVATDESGGAGLVRSFSFDPASGALTELSSKSAGGAGSTHVSFAPTGKWVFVANYTGGNASVLPIDLGTGMLGDAADTVASGEKSHWAGTDPSGKFVFVPALGNDAVSQYTLDGSSGKLTANGTAALPGGAGPRHLAFHPTQPWAYTMNELDVTVSTFDLDTNGGTLNEKSTISALPVGQSAVGVSGAEIFVHPSGKTVYGSTRVYNSIAVFTIAGDGTLSLSQNAPTGANRPRSFGLDPEGTLLYAGNENADEVVGFRIGASDGKLTSLGKTTDVPGPTFVGLARMP